MEALRVQEEIRRKNHQSHLLIQIEDKKQSKNQEVQDLLYDERAAKIWEMEYKKKLSDQKDIHKKRVIDKVIYNIYRWI